MESEFNFAILFFPTKQASEAANGLRFYSFFYGANTNRKCFFTPLVLQHFIINWVFYVSY